MAEKVRSRQLEWLGHVVKMLDNRMTTRLLFAALLAVCPACGSRLRWKCSGPEAGSQRAWLIDIFRQPVMQEIDSSLLRMADV